MGDQRPLKGAGENPRSSEVVHAVKFPPEFGWMAIISKPRFGLKRKLGWH
jgi:hypothetical protein